MKLFGSSRMNGDQVHAWVAPVMVGKAHPLYSVSDVFNGILVRGNMLGETMYYGSGAGKLPTASAVVADIVEAAQNLDQNVKLGWNGERLQIADPGTSCHRYFVRIAGEMAKKLPQVQDVFGVVEAVALEGQPEFAVLTEQMSQAQFAEKAETFDAACREAQEAGILKWIRAEL